MEQVALLGDVGRDVGASVTAYLSPTMSRKRAISSAGSGGTAGCSIFMAIL